MNTCQIQQTTKTLKFVPANNTSLKVVERKKGRKAGGKGRKKLEEDKKGGGKKMQVEG